MCGRNGSVSDVRVSGMLERNGMVDCSEAFVERNESVVDRNGCATALKKSDVDLSGRDVAGTRRDVRCSGS